MPRFKAPMSIPWAWVSLEFLPLFRPACGREEASLGTRRRAFSLSVLGLWKIMVLAERPTQKGQPLYFDQIFYSQNPFNVCLNQIRF